jgi:hypothetical protein
MRVPFAFQEFTGAGVSRGGFGAGAKSSRVNRPPHTLQFQAMTLAAGVWEFCGVHFLDNSPPHSGQIMLLSFYRESRAGACGPGSGRATRES